MNGASPTQPEAAATPVAIWRSTGLPGATVGPPRPEMTANEVLGEAQRPCKSGAMQRSPYGCGAGVTPRGPKTNTASPSSRPSASCRLNQPSGKPGLAGVDHRGQRPPMLWSQWQPTLIVQGQEKASAATTPWMPPELTISESPIWKVCRHSTRHNK